MAMKMIRRRCSPSGTGKYSKVQQSKRCEVEKGWIEGARGGGLSA